MMSTSLGQKIASIRPSGFEKIVLRHQILDRQTAAQKCRNTIYDSKSAIYSTAHR